MTLTAPTPAAAGWKTLRHGLAFTTAEPEPARRMSGLRRGALAGAALLACLGFGLLAAGGSDPSPTVAAAPQAAPPPRPAAPAWIDVVRPFMAYDLAGGPFARLPLRYEARRSPAGDARQDVLTYGDPRPGTPFLRLAFTRQGAEPGAEAGLFVDAVRLAGGAGLAVTRSGQGFRLETRFGPFEVTGVTVTGDGRPADCLAMRLDAPDAAAVLRLVGLACGGVGAPLTPEALACTIDKLDLVSAGDDDALRAVFVAAERRRRDGCAAIRSPDLSLGSAAARPDAGVLLKSTF